MTQAHGQAGDQVELRQAELQGPYDTHQWFILDSGKIGPAQRDGDEIADRDSDQNGHVLNEAGGEFDDGQDHEQNQGGDQQITRGAEIGRRRTAAGPVDANARQDHPDHGDDRAGDDRGEKPQHIFDERRDA